MSAMHHQPPQKPADVQFTRGGAAVHHLSERVLPVHLMCAQRTPNIRRKQRRPAMVPSPGVHGTCFVHVSRQHRCRREGGVGSRAGWASSGPRQIGTLARGICIYSAKCGAKCPEYAHRRTQARWRAHELVMCVRNDPQLNYITK